MHVATSQNPLVTLASWMQEAETRGVPEPNAMALATATPDGAPSVRFVLCRGIDDRGVRFFTNYQSRKGAELTANARAAVAIHWAQLQRQARVEGRVILATPQESDAYFHGRPRGSQIASAVSPQSRPVASLDELRAQCNRLEERLQGSEVPRPDHWGGYWIVADVVELWSAGNDRLHDRTRYARRGDGWVSERLAP